MRSTTRTRTAWTTPHSTPCMKVSREFGGRSGPASNASVPSQGESDRTFLKKLCQRLHQRPRNAKSVARRYAITAVGLSCPPGRFLPDKVELQTKACQWIKLRKPHSEQSLAAVAQKAAVPLHRSETTLCAKRRHRATGRTAAGTIPPTAWRVRGRT